MGFRRIGVFTRSGYKFGRWYNMSWTEKLLMEHPEHPEPVIPFPQLDKALGRRHPSPRRGIKNRNFTKNHAHPIDIADGVCYISAQVNTANR